MSSRRSVWDSSGPCYPGAHRGEARGPALLRRMPPATVGQHPPRLLRGAPTEVAEGTNLSQNLAGATARTTYRLAGANGSTRFIYESEFKLPPGRSARSRAKSGPAPPKARPTTRSPASSASPKPDHQGSAGRPRTIASEPSAMSRVGQGQAERAALGVPADRPALAGVDHRAPERSHAFERAGQVVDLEVGQGEAVPRPAPACVHA